MGFGTAVVDLGENITWEELLEASRTQKRLKPVNLKLRDVEEIVRAPDTPCLSGRSTEKSSKNRPWLNSGKRPPRPSAGSSCANSS